MARSVPFLALAALLLVAAAAAQTGRDTPPKAGTQRPTGQAAPTSAPSAPTAVGRHAPLAGRASTVHRTTRVTFDEGGNPTEQLSASAIYILPDGSTLTYKYEDGKEDMQLNGKEPEGFDKESLLEEMRRVAGVSTGQPPALETAPQEAQGEEEEESSLAQRLLDPFAPFWEEGREFDFVRPDGMLSRIIGGMKSQLKMLTLTEVERRRERIAHAKAQIKAIDAEHNSIMTQESVLNTRLQEMSGFLKLQGTLSDDKRFPAVEELVSNEQKRLEELGIHLAETRAHAMARKNMLMNFIERESRRLPSENEQRPQAQGQQAQQQAKQQ